MQLIPYLLIAPLAAAFLIPVLGKKMKNSPDILALIASLALTVLSYILAGSVITHKVFVYKAKSKGDVVKGEIMAADASIAKILLKKQGIEPISIKAKNQAGSSAGGRVNAQDITKVNNTLPVVVRRYLYPSVNGKVTVEVNAIGCLSVLYRAYCAQSRCCTCARKYQAGAVVSWAIV